jgi:hypothetical protein
MFNFEFYDYSKKHYLEHFEFKFVTSTVVERSIISRFLHYANASVEMTAFPKKLEI